MLDHRYFLSEIEVAQTVADSLIESLFHQRGDNKGTPTEWQVLQHLKVELLKLQHFFRLMVHFEPKDYVQPLQNAYQGIDAVKSHNQGVQEQYLAKASREHLIIGRRVWEERIFWR